MSTRPFLGITPIVKTAGAGPLSTSAQRNILCTRSVGNNPLNKGYEQTINQGGNINTVTRGKKTPSVQLDAIMKPYVPGSPAVGWADANLFKSLIYLNNSGNTDLFTIGIGRKDSGSMLFNSWEWSRLSRLYIRQTDMQSAPVLVTMNFMSRWGGDCPYGTTLASGEVAPTASPTYVVPTNSDTGYNTGPLDVQFVGIDGVRGWELTLTRGQAYAAEADGDTNPYDIESTVFNGALTIRQREDAATTITNAGAIDIKLNTGMTSTTGRFKISCQLQTDNFPLESQATSFGMRSIPFTLADLATGGIPAAFVAY